MPAVAEPVLKDVEENGSSVADGTIEGHEYVDLGLSVKWATCNMGASSPEKYGNYYAWGETETKRSYIGDNCDAWEKEIGDIGGTDRDVAHVKWGGSWRLPTAKEVDELCDNCIWTWTTREGVDGYKVTSKKNGKSIFLPAAGTLSETSLYGAGEYGLYWSSTPFEKSSAPLEDGNYLAYSISFDSGDYKRGGGFRCWGASVRPVSE